MGDCMDALKKWSSRKLEDSMFAWSVNWKEGFSVMSTKEPFRNEAKQSGLSCCEFQELANFDWGWKTQRGREQAAKRKMAEEFLSCLPEKQLLDDKKPGQRDCRRRQLIQEGQQKQKKCRMRAGRVRTR